MRGGAQSHLMRCGDGHYYVVKFQNNPQHRRFLVNEVLGTRLAARLGLPTAPVSVVDVPEELIRLMPDLVMEYSRERIPCQAGPQFGSRYPGDPKRVALHDFLPDQQLREVANLHDFAGMLVFDKWTCKHQWAATLFLHDVPGETGSWPDTTKARNVRRDSPRPYVVYRTLMIDQGFCFNAGEWYFADAPLRDCMHAIACMKASRP